MPYDIRIGRLNVKSDIIFFNGRDRSQGKRALIFIWKSDYEHTIYDT